MLLVRCKLDSACRGNLCRLLLFHHCFVVKLLLLDNWIDLLQHLELILLEKTGPRAVVALMSDDILQVDGLVYLLTDAFDLTEELEGLMLDLAWSLHVCGADLGLERVEYGVRGVLWINCLFPCDHGVEFLNKKIALIRG